MKMTAEKLHSWVSRLSNTKPYRIIVKNGQGFYEIIFWYNEYHYNERIFPSDMEDEMKCQKKILHACNVFETNFKLQTF